MILIIIAREIRLLLTEEAFEQFWARISFLQISLDVNVFRRFGEWDEKVCFTRIDLTSTGLIGNGG